MNCPIRNLKANRPAPESCQERFAEKENLCDFPYCGSLNVYSLIIKFLEEQKELAG